MNQQVLAAQRSLLRCICCDEEQFPEPASVCPGISGINQFAPTSVFASGGPFTASGNCAPCSPGTVGGVLTLNFNHPSGFSWQGTFGDSANCPGGATITCITLLGNSSLLAARGWAGKGGAYWFMPFQAACDGSVGDECQAGAGGPRVAILGAGGLRPRAITDFSPVGVYRTQFYSEPPVVSGQIYHPSNCGLTNVNQPFTRSKPATLLVS